MSQYQGCVLVVDDEPVDVAFLRRALESRGFEVLDSDSYESAIRVFGTRSEDIELVLIDVSLPGRNGIELAKALLRKKADLKMLFTSGHVGAEVLRFYGLPATDEHFLQKPFTPTALLGRIEETMKSPARMEWLRDQDGSASSDAPSKR